MYVLHTLGARSASRVDVTDTIKLFEGKEDVILSLDGECHAPKQTNIFSFSSLKIS
jgi:hypothetical protein